ncbi:MAG TPA: hypothetical protein VIG55_04980 [Methylosinus sp.]
MRDRLREHRAIDTMRHALLALRFSLDYRLPIGRLTRHDLFTERSVLGRDGAQWRKSDLRDDGQNEQQDAE